MRQVLCTVALLAATTSVVSGQVFVDPFNYPDGPSFGAWVEDKGNWNAVGNQAESEQVFAWQYCTIPTIPKTQDACVDCDVRYNTASSQALQFGGVALRMAGAATDTNLIMVKIQDNNSSGDFDSLWLYERPGGATSNTTWGVATSARVRLLAIDNDVMAFADTNNDGVFDVVLRRTVALTPAAGPVGIDGFGGALIDNFAFFDAVIMPLASNPTPTPGAKIDYKLRGVPSTAYQVATSLGNGGIALPTGSTIPLSLDPIFFASISGTLPGVFQGYAGAMDANGDASASLLLPAVPQLVGITLYTAFVNMSGTTFISTSNEDQVTIQ